MNSGGTHLTQTRQVTQHAVLGAEGIQPPAGGQWARGSKKTEAGPGVLGTACPLTVILQETLLCRASSPVTQGTQDRPHTNQSN